VIHYDKGTQVSKTIVSDTRAASQASNGRLKGVEFYKGGTQAVRRVV
jgi:hypothetical protein